MSLAEYRGKRQFARTPEPKGRQRQSPGQIFVVQQHGARRLHFDLRLELGGTLKSWAVPKGISLDPAEKRLAVHVEDHPTEYATFEGNIPAGEYGAGAVIVWDHGTWEPLGDGEKDYAKGKLKFRLHGEKLRGAWMLVRIRNKEGETADNWLIIKERDESAVPLAQLDVVAERPESVVSGRTLAEVAFSGDDKSKAGAKKRSKNGRNGGVLLRKIRETVHSRPGPLPASVEPALARMTSRAPAGDLWLHEIKFDGYRLLAWLDYGEVHLRTRNGHDWTARFPEIAAAISRLPANVALLDGEVVALLPNGASSFSGLQQALSSRRSSVLVYCIFDALNIEGFDLRPIALEQRKELLRDLLANNLSKRLQFVNHVQGNGAEFFAHCRDLGLEGIVSKRQQSPYRSGRSDEWQKIKAVQAEPFVIGGYTSVRGRKEMRALMVGYHDERGQLIYAGRVGTGFDEATFAECEKRLQAISRPDCPFATRPPKEADRDVHWVRPQMVAQVRFAGWSSDRILRHPVFAGLRDDSDPTEIVREPTANAGQRTAEPEPKPGAQMPKSSRLAKKRPLKVGQPDLAGVHLTNPGKVLYPDVGVTKLDLLKYYFEIADWILPHLIDRPLSLVRCPDGIQGQTFYQKHAGPETPTLVRRILLPEFDESAEFLYVRDLKGLVSLAQVGVLEIHPWSSRIDQPDRPDRMIFDLDPDPAVPWSLVVEAAFRIRQRLTDAGLVSFIKTSGGKGLHIVVPLERRHTYDEIKRYSQRFVQDLASDYPRSYTASQSKRARPGKIYIDYLRNARGATAVAAYSTRARAGAPVSTPVAWAELTAELKPDQFNVRNLATRLNGLTSDPWAEIGSVRQALPGTTTRRGKRGTNHAE